jgi:hypothetical protein
MWNVNLPNAVYGRLGTALILLVGGLGVLSSSCHTPPVWGKSPENGLRNFGICKPAGELNIL